MRVAPLCGETTPGWGRMVLWGILAVAAALRFWGIRYGLPYVYYPDEAEIINRAVAMGSGDLNPHSFVYGALPMYFLAFFYGVSFVVGYIGGWVGSTHEFALLFVTDPSYFYLSARTIVALLGVGTVALAYVLGRKLFDWRVGLAAAGLLALQPGHVNFSHFTKAEVPQAFFIALTLLGALSVLEKGGARRYLLSGVLAGICAAIKFPGCLVFASVFAAHAFRSWGGVCAGGCCWTGTSGSRALPWSQRSWPPTHMCCSTIPAFCTSSLKPPG